MEKINRRNRKNMEKPKNDKKSKRDQQKYPTKRISSHAMKQLERIGEGNWKHGLDKAINTYELLERDPSLILHKELEQFGNLVQAFLPENHFEHYVDSNLPALLRIFIKTGRIDPSILNKRAEKALDKFEEIKGANKKTDKETDDAKASV